MDGLQTCKIANRALVMMGSTSIQNRLEIVAPGLNGYIQTNLETLKILYVVIPRRKQKVIISEKNVVVVKMIWIVTIDTSQLVLDKKI